MFSMRIRRKGEAEKPKAVDENRHDTHPLKKQIILDVTREIEAFLTASHLAVEIEIGEPDEGRSGRSKATYGAATD